MSIVDRATTGFPPDLLNRAATRLQILAWLYAFTFFMAAFFPRLLIPAQRMILFERAVNWAPGAISIAVAASVALAIPVIQLRPSRSSPWRSKWSAAMALQQRSFSNPAD